MIKKTKGQPAELFMTQFAGQNHRNIIYPMIITTQNSHTINGQEAEKMWEN